MIPKLNTPRYTLVIPSTQQKVSYRPFLVKEEKILLMAQESNDPVDAFNAMRDAISACILDEIDVNSLTIYDIDYMFLKLRGKSVGESAEIKLACEKCEAKNDVTIDLDSVELKWPERRMDPVVKLTDSVGVTLQHPTIGDAVNMPKNVDASQLTALVKMGIKNIFDSNDVHPIESVSDSQLDEFVNSMTRSQLEKITEFLENVPKVHKVVEFTCSCGHHNQLTVEGSTSFFD